MTDVLHRAQAWLDEADKKGINITDEYGYLAVIRDLASEVRIANMQIDKLLEQVADLTKSRHEDALVHERETAALRAMLDAGNKNIADALALQPQKPVVIEKPHGPVGDQLMQKFYGAKR